MIEKECLTCKKTFQAKKSITKFCCGTCSMKHPDTIKKRKETSLKKYGVNNWNNPKKRIAAFEEKYGYRSPFELEQVRNKSKQTFLKKYSIEHNSTLRKANLPKEQLDDFYNKDKLTCEEIGEIYSVKRTCVENYMRTHGLEINKISVQSKEERKIQTLLKENNIEFECNTRKIITPKELDIWIPKYNLGIEINGLYWHSELKKDKFYHHDKRNLCLKNNIKLLQFYDYEIQTKYNIVKSIILNNTNRNNKIYARNCKIVIPSKDETKRFIDINHLQGNIPCKASYGLLYNNELVSLMTFGIPRFNKKYNFELLRFCNKLNTIVIGGASKLFTAFKKEYKGSIITYCNRNLFDGKVYENMGFKHIHDSSPSYIYFSKKESKIYSRYQCQKHKLSKLLDNYDNNKTEYENMLNNGYIKIWDTGHGVYELCL
jgi:hypothetical protein